MRTYCLIIVISFFNLNCKSQVNITPNSEFKIDLLNDSIHIPILTDGFCIDTLYFKIVNNTQNDFVFENEDSSFYFNFNQDERKYQLDSTYTSPYDGINLRFIDENHQSLETEYYNLYYYDEQVEDIDTNILSSIKIIKAKSEYILKTILKFPNYQINNELLQRINNPKKAKYVKIVFETDPELAKSILKDTSININNVRYLNTKDVFYRPVSFNCN